MKDSKRSEGQNEHVLQELQQQSQSITSTNNQISNYTADYEADLYDTVIPNKKQLLMLLQSTGSIKCSSQWANTLSVKVISTEFQSSILQLSIGFYKLRITALYTLLDVNFEDEEFVGGGGFGKIYKVERQKQIFAVKSVGINNTQNTFQCGQNKIYQECMIAKICSVLKIGPKILNPFGYDIVFFKNAAIFCMELCENYEGESEYKISKEKSLKISLKILHSLHVCHSDVKTENVLWSRTFQKFVFIDFGLSRFVENEVGFQTPTEFVGTYYFVCPQMKKLFFLKTVGYVDLYYNDLFGLKKIVQSSNSEGHKEKEEKSGFFANQMMKAKEQTDFFANPFQSKTKSEALSQILIILLAKYFIFTQRIPFALKIFQKYKNMPKSSIQILQFHLPRKDINQQQATKFQAIINYQKRALQKNQGIILQSDLLLSSYLQNYRQKNDLLPLDWTIKLQSEDFKKLMQNTVWKNRIYIILNPFATFMLKVPINSKQNLNTFKNKLIQKIYGDLDLGEKTEKIDAIKQKKVLKYFHEFLISQQNLQLLKYGRFLLKHMRQPPSIIKQIDMTILELSKYNAFLFIVHSMFLFLDWQCYQCFICLPTRHMQYLYLCKNTCQLCLDVYKGNTEISDYKFNQGLKFKNIIEIILRITQSIFQLVKELAKSNSGSQYLINIVMQADKLLIQSFPLYIKFDLIIIKNKLYELFYINIQGQKLRKQYDSDAQTNEIKGMKNQLLQIHYEKINQIKKQYQYFYEINTIQSYLSIFPSLQIILKQLILNYDKKKNQIYFQFIEYYFQVFKNQTSFLNKQFWEIVHFLMSKNRKFGHKIIQKYMGILSSIVQIPLKDFYGHFRKIIFFLCKTYDFKKSVLIDIARLETLNDIDQQNLKQQLKYIYSNQKIILDFSQSLVKKLQLILPSLQNCIISQEEFKKYFLSKNSPCEDFIQFSQKILPIERELLSLIKLIQCTILFQEHSASEFITEMENIFKLHTMNNNKNLFVYLEMLIQLKKKTTRQFSNKLCEYIDLKIIEIVRPFSQLKFKSLSLFFKENDESTLQVIKIFAQKHMYEQNTAIIFELIMGANETKQSLRYPQIIKSLIKAISIYCNKTKKNFMKNILKNFIQNVKITIKQSIFEGINLFFVFQILVAVQGLIETIYTKRLLILVAHSMPSLNSQVKRKINQNFYRLHAKNFIKDYQFRGKSKTVIKSLRLQIKNNYEVYKQVTRLISFAKDNHNKQKPSLTFTILCLKINAMMYMK